MSPTSSKRKKTRSMQQHSKQNGQASKIKKDKSKEAFSVISPTMLPVHIYKDPSELRKESTIFGVQGKRPTMEDETVIATFDHLEMYGVFDGHAGDQVAKYVASTLPEVLLPRMAKSSSEDMEQVIIDCFLQVDREVFNQKLPSGSCALVSVFNNLSNELWLINLGDSKGFVFSDAFETTILTEERTPIHPEERKRIEGANSKVTKIRGSVERIDGNLAVSRAFGDNEWKIPTQGSAEYTGEKGAVSVVPLIQHSVLDLSKQSYYMLLACDGFWYDGGITQPFKPDELMFLIGRDGISAKELCEEALYRGSSDNVTCVLIHFNKL